MSGSMKFNCMAIYLHNRGKFYCNRITPFLLQPEYMFLWIKVLKLLDYSFNFIFRVKAHAKWDYCINKKPELAVDLGLMYQQKKTN